MPEPSNKVIYSRWRYSGRSNLVGFAFWFVAGMMFSVHSQTLLEDVYRQAEKNRLPKGSIAVGSGSFVSSTAVLTSAHVIAGCLSFEIENPSAGARLARVAYVDRRRDAAILEVAGPGVQNFIGAWRHVGEGNLRILGYSAFSGANRDPNTYRTKVLGFDDAAVIALSTNVPAGMSGGPVIDEHYSLVGILAGRLQRGGVATVASPVSSFPANVLRYFGGRSSGRITSAVVKIRCTR